MSETVAGMGEGDIKPRRGAAVNKNHGGIQQARPIRVIQLSTSMNPEGYVLPFRTQDG
jgi:hypothetical protein